MAPFLLFAVVLAKDFANFVGYQKKWQILF